MPAPSLFMALKEMAHSFSSVGITPWAATGTLTLSVAEITLTPVLFSPKVATAALEIRPSASFIPSSSLNSLISDSLIPKLQDTSKSLKFCPVM